MQRDDPTPAPWTSAGKKKIKELGLVMQVRVIQNVQIFMLVVSLIGPLVSHLSPLKTSDWTSIPSIELSQ